MVEVMIVSDRVLYHTTMRRGLSQLGKILKGKVERNGVVITIGELAKFGERKVDKSGLGLV